jgi:hypothetical protein
MKHDDHWRSVPGYPNYFMSDQDQVFTVPRKGSAGGLLKISMLRGRWPRVCLTKDGKQHWISISTLHKLVWP